VIRSIAALTIVVLTALAHVPVALAAPPPLEAFFGRTVLGDAKLSPDGFTVAMRMGGVGQRDRLVVLDLRTFKPLVVASFDDRDINAFSWVNDSRLVFDLGVELTGLNRADAGPGLFAVNKDGEQFRALVETNGAWVKAPPVGVPLLRVGTRLIRTLPASGDASVIVGRAEEVSREKIDYIALQRLNTSSGRASDLEPPLHSFDWTFDAAGQLRAVRTQEKGTVTTLLLQADGSWKQVYQAELLSADAFVPRFVDADGTLYVEAGHGDHTALFTFDAATGKLSAKPVAASQDFSLHSSFVANDRKLLGVRYVIDAEVTQWLDDDMKALQATIDAVLPATSNRLSVPRRGDSPWVLVQSFADQQPLAASMYNRQTRKLVRLGSSHPALEPAQLGRADFVRIKARDGLSIPAYLTLPPGAGSQTQPKLPLVVLVHGGPWVRGAQWHFDPEAQFLATRGYAVLQPEFRGSTGYGRRHFEAGFKQWGRTMQDDVADAARWAVAQGIADAKRICIAGASYGGYSTLMGLARDPDLYRCGVAWVGVTDPMMLFTVSWSDATEESKRYGLSQLVGDPVADAAMLKAASPIENASRIKQPLLLAYGAWDVRVPIIHGEKFRDAIKPYNPNVEWVVYGDEGHGWSKAATRIDFWGRVEKFLARHNAP
jgi:dipeptidyl aminopeptidase/acylaminoacyl peptidase